MAACGFLVRPFQLSDVYKLNETNLDAFTENFSTGFYWEYIAQWPELCVVAQGYDGRIIGYIIGRLDGEDANTKVPIQRRDAEDVWHGHVSALSVSPGSRGRKVASQLMDYFEKACFAFGSRFIDLYVRETNTAAITLYKKRGYITHQVLEKYYVDSENGLEMRLY